MIIDASAYGILPGIDSTEGFIRAFEAVQASETPVIMKLSPEVYHVCPDRAMRQECYISNTTGADPRFRIRTVGWFMEGLKDLTIDGCGATVIFHGKMMMAAGIRCEGLTLANMTLDFAVPTVIDVTAEQVTAAEVILKVPECYGYEVQEDHILWYSDKSPYTGERYWKAVDGLGYNQTCFTDSGITYRESCPLFEGVLRLEDLGSHRIRLVYEKTPERIVPGACYEMRYTDRDHAGMWFWKSKDICLKDLTIRYLHGFGVVGQNTENVRIENCVIAPEEGSGRHTAGFADFIQMSGCKGAIEIRNCEFMGPHDDPINVHGTFLQVTEVLSERQVKVQFMHPETAGFPNYFPGDQVEFINRRSLKSDGEARVLKVEGPSGVDHHGSLTEILLTLDRPIPEMVQKDSHVVENVTWTPSLLVEGCSFSRIPTRAILVTTRRPVVIRNNRFETTGMAAISISDDANGWYESGACEDVLIENNTFENIGMMDETIPVILIEPTSFEERKPVHGRVQIRQNHFGKGCGKPVHSVSVKELLFE